MGSAQAAEKLRCENFEETVATKTVTKEKPRTACIQIKGNRHLLFDLCMCALITTLVFFRVRQDGLISNISTKFDLIYDKLNR
jgi:hypothetical protein